MFSFTRCFLEKKPFSLLAVHAVFLSILILPGRLLAQTAPSGSWLTFEDEEMGLSLAFPATALVDNEPNKGFQISPRLASLPDLLTTVRKPRIVGYERSLFAWLDSIELRMAPSPKTNLANYIGPEQAGESRQFFQVGNFVGVKITDAPTGKGLSARIILAKKKKVFLLRASARLEDEDLYAKFFKSLRLDGQYVFGGTSANVTVIPFSKLKTSQEVLDYRSLDDRKSSVNVVSSVAPVPVGPDPDTQKYSKPLIILDSPPTIIGNNVVVPERSFARIRVTYLATGKIGDIEVFRGQDKGLTDALVKSVKESVFIPAEIDGKKVDVRLISEINLR